MPDLTPNIGAFVSIDKRSLQGILDVLKAMGFTLVGPTLDDGVIVYDEIDQVSDLPIGWTDRQDAGTYRVVRRGDEAYFGYVAGPHSWKQFLFPPRLRLAKAEQRNGSFAMTGPPSSPARHAFIGVRGCDMQAITIQDRVFLGGPFQEPDYKARRQGAFVLAVNCTEPGGTCFCASVGSGPRVGPGFDLAMTELDDIFVIEVGSEIGCEVMREVEWRPTSAFELQTVRQAIAEAGRHMGRQLDTSDLPNLLYQNLESPRWDQVAQRCLSCTSCTQVCPTCFCSDILELGDLKDMAATRVRVWDSCFSLDFSHVHGGNIRPHTRSRYRQWLTHKLATWVDHYGMLGCVGCGRCITWCPVGIDITEEVRAIREEV